MTVQGGNALPGFVTNYNLNGYMSQLGFWKRALTPAEVASLYNGGAGLAY